MRTALIFLMLVFCQSANADAVQPLMPILSDSGPTVGDKGRQGSQGESQPLVIDVVLHDRQAILRMLQRAETLAMTPNPVERPREIALVLHGPEIEHFRISKYSGNQDIVDLAAKLDAFNVIDIKMCNTMMNQLNVDRREIPAFIEIVPYGPDEVDTLQREGFLKL